MALGAFFLDIERFVVLDVYLWGGYKCRCIYICIYEVVIEVYQQCDNVSPNISGGTLFQAFLGVGFPLRIRRICTAKI